MSEVIYVMEDSKKRKATTDELAQMEKDRAEQLERDLLLEAAELEKQKAKESGMKKLKVLGLTDSEIAVLLGN